MILSKKGFTLVELLVVMSIISVLAAALIVSIPKVTERARDMKCKANLRNLSQAAQTFAIQNEHYPRAHPGEYKHLTSSGVRYSELSAWVNWTGNGRWPNRDSQRSQMTMPMLSTDLAYDALTNGTLWSLTGKQVSSYLCPAFKKAAITQGLKDVRRSYVMNHYFHWHGGGSGFYWHGDFTRTWGGIQRSAETVLMFAELPMDQIDTSEEGGDGKLDPENDNEHIGFNHHVGKRNIAHVVYADGHVGVLLEPENSSKSELVELSKQLCQGDEIDRSLLQEMR